MNKRKLFAVSAAVIISLMAFILEGPQWSGLDTGHASAQTVSGEDSSTGFRDNQYTPRGAETRNEDGGTATYRFVVPEAYMSLSPKSYDSIEYYKKRGDKTPRQIKVLSSTSIQLITDKYVLSYGNQWEAVPVSQGIHHLRNDIHWKDFFWEVDAFNNKVFKVRNGTFGLPGGEKTEIKSIRVNRTGINYLGSRDQVFLDFSNLDLSVDEASKIVTLSLDGDILLSEQWELIKLSPDTYHARRPRWKNHNIYIKLIPSLQTVYFHKDNYFHGVRPVDRGIEQADDEGILPDYGRIAIDHKPIPKLKWFEVQKGIYGDFLRQKNYDVLVVPFQVQQYAIDRTGRSLMTRYLVDYIQRTTNLNLPSPTLVDKALREGFRRYDMRDVFSLAEKMKVKKLIVGYVGHDRNMNMRISIKVITRNSKGSLPRDKDGITFSWEQLKFSDTHLPSEVFKENISKIVSKLQLKQTRKYSVKKYNNQLNQNVPENLETMVEQPPDSPVASALLLQFLGTLYPNDSATRSALFERSLVALSSVSSETPGYKLIKARALLNLNRRPAALMALGSPKTPERKALYAYANGNLPEHAKWTGKITSPLLKLIATVEHSYLRTLYTGKLPSGTEAQFILSQYPGWELELSSKLAFNALSGQHILFYKERLDKSYPVTGPTAEGLILKFKTAGNSSSLKKEMWLSVHNHVKTLLTAEERSGLIEDDSDSIVKLDYIDYLYEASVSAILSDIGRYGTSYMEAIEDVYGGHPEFEFLRFRTAYYKNPSDSMKSHDERLTAYYAAQGQTSHYAPAIQESIRGYYDADFPPSSLWDAYYGDRAYAADIPAVKDLYKMLVSNKMKNLSVKLLYSQYSFRCVEEFYHKLVNGGYSEIADEFLSENRNRFRGSSVRAKFLVDTADDSGDYERLKEVLNDEIRMFPENWSSYMKLGLMYIKKGDLQSALKSFKRYPLYGPAQKTDVAYELYWRGALDASISLLKEVADGSDPSYSGITINAMLALYEGKYETAYEAYKRLTQAYNSLRGYGNVISFLHLFGNHKEAWSIFDTMDKDNFPHYIFRAAFVGHRAEGRTTDEVLEWMRKDETILRSRYAPNFLFHYAIIDRPPSNDYVKNTMKINMFARGDISYLASFADGLYKLRTNSNREAYEVFSNLAMSAPISLITLLPSKSNAQIYGGTSEIPPPVGSVYHYAVISGIKAGESSALSRLEKSYLSAFGPTYSYYIGKAYKAASAGNYSESIKRMRQAQYNITLTKPRPLFIWYQMVEAAEMLYKDTAHEPFRKLAVEWAKYFQAIQPMYAWAYAVEAKYTENTGDRIRALGYALYLDRHSERISGFPEEEKSEAEAWFKKHNPFKEQEDKPDFST